MSKIDIIIDNILEDYEGFQAIEIVNNYVEQLRPYVEFAELVLKRPMYDHNIEELKCIRKIGVKP